MQFDPRQSNPVGIVLVLVTIVGLFAAVVVGHMVARNDFIKIGMIAAAAIGMIIVLGLGKNIWLLIPLGWMLSGQITMLPLPFAVKDLCVLAAFGSFVILAVFKKLPKFGALTNYDLLMFANLAYLVTVFIRNPVGVRAFGSEMVGGRPYLGVIIALFGYWVLQHVTITVKESRMLPWLMVMGSTVVAFLGILTEKIPALVPLIYPFYSGISSSSYLAGQRGENYNEFRQGNLAHFSTLADMLLAKFQPFQLFMFLRPFWSLLLYGSIVAILLSGFRSLILSFSVSVFLCSYFYGGFRDIIRVGVVMLFGVTFIVGLQTAGFSVHPAAQRALSFIPAPWDAWVVETADDSSEWRFEMWEIALENDKYIKNKILGDGFGFSSYELNIQLGALYGQGGYIGAGRTEAELVTGAFHSGPVSSIRYVGVLGFLIFTVFLVACAFYAWKIINKSKGTPFFPLALFISVPVIYKPFGFIFIFGSFDADLPRAIIYLAFLNLTARGLNFYTQEQILPPKIESSESNLPNASFSG